MVATVGFHEVVREGVTPATLELLRAHAAGINKRAAKLGLALRPVEVAVTREFTVRDPSDALGVRRLPRFDVALVVPSVDAVVLPGFEGVGLAQAADEGDVQAAGTCRIVTRFTGVDPALDLAAFHADAVGCRECGAVRRRNTVLLLRESATGEVFPVGTDCAGVYLPRAANTVALLEVLTAFPKLAAGDADDGGAPGAHGRAVYGLREVLGLAVVHLRANPYVKASGTADFDGPRPTKAVLQQLLHGVGAASDALRAAHADVEAAQAPGSVDAEVDAVEAWVAGLAGGSDYERNLISSFELGFATERTFGIVVSAVAVAKRDRERAAAAQAAPKGGYFGVPGQKIGQKGTKKNPLPPPPAGTVTVVAPYDGQYGTTYRTVVVLDSGEELLWWASSDPGVSVGDKVTVAATVKKHEEFKGAQKTVITRATLTRVAP